MTSDLGDDEAARPSPGGPIAESPWIDDAPLGVHDPALRALLTEHWEWVMRTAPTWATALGDHRYDDRIEDVRYEAVLEQRKERRAFLERARAIDAVSLREDDRVTLALFLEELGSRTATDVCDFESWALSSFDNPLTEWNYLARLHQIQTGGDAQNLLERYAAVPAAIRAHEDNLKKGLSRGLATNEESLRRTIEMFDKQLAEPIEDWALMKPAKAPLEGLDEGERKRFRAELRRRVVEGIRPALVRYVAFLRDDVQKGARPDGEAGLSHVPNGAACYEAQIRLHTGLSPTAEELHKTGQEEMARINEEMQVLGQRLFQRRKLGDILERLRSDRSLYFDSEDAVEAAAKQALEHARAKMAAYFGTVPKAPCKVERVPEYQAPYTTIAYYRPPHPDGSKPGEYFVNTYEPETRPRYTAEVLAYHEAIPGHHVQIAIAQELPALPAFRKHMGVTAFVEGWALYTERLADEMGLYGGDLARMGMLTYEAWRAGRLVVDTGIHALGWTRTEAEKYLLERTALSANNIENEVDRYISWPGQALAYKVGQLEILRLRAHAERELGEAFDIRAFHDVVLGAGAVSVAVLEGRVNAWIGMAREE